MHMPMPRVMAHRRLLSLALTGAVVASAIAAVAIGGAASGASREYQAARDAYRAHLEHALDAGFTRQQLAAAVDEGERLQAAAAPVWPSDRATFYHSQAQSFRALDARLRIASGAALEQDRTAAATALDAARTKISDGLVRGVDPDDAEPLTKQLEVLAHARDAAASPADLVAVSTVAQSTEEAARKLVDARAADNAELERIASGLKAQQGPEAMQAAARQALTAGRNDATVAAYLKIDAVSRDYRNLERFAAMASSGGDVDRLAFATAGAQHYAGRVHATLMGGMPAHAIVVSVAAQRLWAYQQGNVVLNTVVTTGRPALPTDVGTMKVLWKSAPWKMHSPWPKGSPYYYPDIMVRKVLWFTSSGEGLHDASWRSWYGPGSNAGDGTHGCINLPGRTVDFLFDWADVGTPVVVYPGDGSSQADQLKRITIEDPAAASALKGA